MLFFHGMPNPISVFYAMVIAKLVGYSIAGIILRKYYGRGPNFLIFALLRIVLGFVIGFSFLLVGSSIAVAIPPIVTDEAVRTNPLSGIPILFSLILSRILIWAGLVWLLYERPELNWIRFAVVVLLGTIFSFFVDFVAVTLYGIFEGQYGDYFRSFLV